MTNRVVLQNNFGVRAFSDPFVFRGVYLSAIMNGDIGPWPLGGHADASDGQLGGMQDLLQLLLRILAVRLMKLKENVGVLAKTLQSIGRN